MSINDLTSIKSVLLHPVTSGLPDTSITLLPQGIPDASKQEKMQYRAMPEASSEREGKVYQYMGADTEEYKNGYFYKCVQSGLDYEWVNLLTQPLDLGTDVTKYTIIKEANVLPTASASSPDMVQVGTTLYGKIQTSNIANTTWLINTSPQPECEPNRSFNINFRSNSTDYSRFRIESYSSEEFNPGVGLYYHTSSSSTRVYDHYNNTWTDNNYKTVEISDGAEVTSNALYCWFLDNATLQSGNPVVGYKYEIINSGEVEEATEEEINNLFRTIEN